jgi:hypothetical protein
MVAVSSTNNAGQLAFSRQNTNSGFIIFTAAPGLISFSPTSTLSAARARCFHFNRSLPEKVKEIEQENFVAGH